MEINELTNAIMGAAIEVHRRLVDGVSRVVNGWGSEPLKS
jgi:hypothetical protein